MADIIKNIFEKFENKILDISSLNELNDLKVLFLGKNGEITNLQKTLKEKSNKCFNSKTKRL